MATRVSVAVAVLVICALAAHHVEGNKCSAGYATCVYGRTCKTNLWSDRNNCGRCGSKCECGPHATSYCTRGKCSFECDRVHGWHDCDGSHRNGCEINLHRDITNCGRCGFKCRAPATFVPYCDHGKCLKKCPPNKSLCGTTCVDTTSDVNNCGHCGTVCPANQNTTAACVSKTCTTVCGTGLTVCDGFCKPLQTDVYNCGTCNNVCPGVSNFTAVCVNGTCNSIGCFPGDATVTLASGSLKLMFDLALGDKVAVRGRDGAVVYEDVYAFGHRDASASSNFVQLTVAPIDDSAAVQTRTLELTNLHFVPVSSGKAGKYTYKRAQDVVVGDKLYGEGSSLLLVQTTSRVQKQGLYNPFTLGGTILVNGVVASTHSEWFLDSLFESLHLLHWLPSAYQAVLLPVRWLYSVMGKEAYLALYNRLDALFDVAAFGTKHAGSLATAALAAFVLVAFTSSRKA